MSEEITLRGKTIRTDEHGRLSLTDMWKVGSEPENKRPVIWLRQHQTKELIAVLKVRHDHLYQPVVTKPGRYGGGTYAHPVLALAYAEYLSPELGVEVREIALRVYAGDITVLEDFKRTYAEQLVEDGNRVMAREEVRRNNSELNGILKEVGASHAAQWAAFHNSGYEGLYDGLNENAIHSRKSLKRGERILDHMGFEELAANMFRTALAQGYLRRNAVSGVKRACEVHKRMGGMVRDDLIEVGSEMPEDMPVLDSIKAAQKRLKHATVKRLAR